MAIDFIQNPKPEHSSTQNRQFDYYIKPIPIVEVPLIDIDAEQKKLDDEKAEFESLKRTDLASSIQEKEIEKEQEEVRREEKTSKHDKKRK